MSDKEVYNHPGSFPRQLASPFGTEFGNGCPMKISYACVAILCLTISCIVFSSAEAETKSHDSTVAGELLVKFKPHITADARAEIHRVIGAELIKRFRSIKVDHIKLKAGILPQSAIEQYRSNPNVEYVEAVGIVSIPK